ncbi:type IIG restriction enzyme/methyltransferase [Fibrivirga algicola]|uniref:site-specific DNA-methyltransferase (adenine-specific) n=1 Tax=Fibrivirga algicola TaxID=2950420 RepID=A0ABX0QN56_9BACT|nr:TaqI-like C-terminal specificity domain-containing protein [Fibrivirga algicola]NID11549.1 class I SAM-dependent DNA methyltransferase [Fibrivirga algicola]
MLLKSLTPTESLDKAYRLQSGNREQIDRFKLSFVKLLGLINEKESEENVKGHLMDFLKEVYYRDTHIVAPKGKTDFVIHAGKDATTPAGVLFEVKRPANRGEMITRQNLNAKAFHELLLYYFRERLDAHNNDIRYCVITNVYEWFIFDAAMIDRVFFRNVQLAKDYKAWASGQKVSINNDLFYNEIAKPFLAALNEELPFTYFDLRDFQTIVTDSDPANDKALLPLYKVLSPTHLLKLPTATDSNRLNPKFYAELLHLIGLEEVKDGGKKVIRRKEAGKRDEGSLLENALAELDSSGKFYQLHDRGQYGANIDEQMFSVALELCITWINRVLFLKLLESQLVTYHNGNKDYAFLNRETIPDFDELNKLFFRVLARKPSERQATIQAKFGRVPYLNSSLFEITDLENDTLGINQLDNGQTLPLLRQSVLNDNQTYRTAKALPTLAYLFAFLEAYDFASESREVIQEKNQTLINASVLGLIFEKINGYKDGSFYTPGFITEYMCRETIRRAVVQKFNDAKGWDCADFAALENKDLDRAEANALINEIRICDPAVGSGHFLVSALNELIAVKSDLGILQDQTGKRIKDYTVSILNDELIVQDEDELPFQYVLGVTDKPTAERQRVQKTLFHEKQTIIENCLFGVDINPNSVKICRLRLWIELLKNAYYTDKSGFTELETLPNIDINIKQGNSLLSKFSLTEDLSDVFRKQKFSLRTYKDAVAAYKEAKSKEAKADLLRFINEIKSQFRETVSNRDPKRKKIADLRGQRVLLANNIDMFGNPIKDPKLVAVEIIRTEKYIEQIEAEIAAIENNASYRGSFEWRFEFPEVLNDKGDFVGFDAVIGNPPYKMIQPHNTSENEIALMRKSFEIADFKIDLFHLFYQAGVNILISNGLLSYITPSSLLNNVYVSKLRKWLIDRNQVILIGVAEQKVFADADVHTAIFMFHKCSEVKPNFRIKLTTELEIAIQGEEKFREIEQIKFGSDINGIWNLLVDESNYQIIHKINAFTPLSKLAVINRGLITGDRNKYFSASQLDIRYVPILTGGDIFRYRNNEPAEYVLFIKPKTSGGCWDRAVHLSTHKICIRQIGKEPTATLISHPYAVTGNIFTVIAQSEKLESYILGLINSKLIKYYWTIMFSDFKDSFPQVTIASISQIPVPNNNQPLQDQITVMVNQILTVKAANLAANTSALEGEIDQLVYALYGLTGEEIAIVEEKY